MLSSTINIYLKENHPTILLQLSGEILGDFAKEFSTGTFGNAKPELKLQSHGDAERALAPEDAGVGRLYIPGMCSWRP
jgi:hypothetical protein